MRILIIGNLGGYLTDAAKIILSKGGEITQAETKEQAVSLLRGGSSFDVLLMDVGEDIPGFLEALSLERIHVLLVACGLGEVTKDQVTQAIRAGAKEYLSLPPDATLIADVLDVLAGSRSKVIFNDPSMEKVLMLTDQVSKSDASILITGESGTGKEVLARMVHQKSARKNKPFVSVNCAAIPENLLESELFGHEKGAFTGAVARRVGKFEEAHGGTLLLDEISEMHPHLQAKLLRAIQEREIDRVGGTKPVSVNIRLLATSNRDMMKEIAAGRFREDLFFRLNVVTITLPPLRERPLDIVSMAHYFVEKYSKANGISRKELSPRSLQILSKHSWPGNVRELENTMHRAILLCSDGMIEPDHLALVVSPPAGLSDPQIGKTLAEAEQAFILSTLDYCAQDEGQAAHLLGLSLRSLRAKIQSYEDHLRQVCAPSHAHDKVS
jgi:two-component system response regulator FlrC